MQDLFQISFKEFISKNPDYKKLNKEIQQKRYQLYEEERESNIERCRQKRREMIKYTKKKTTIENNINQEKEDIIENELEKYPSFRVSSEYPRWNIPSKKKPSPINREKFLITENSYIMNNNGTKQEITKKETEEYECLKTEKKNFEKKAIKKEEQWLRYLKNELDKKKEIKKTKEELKKKDERLKSLMKIKQNGIEHMKNERYQEQQDKVERQKLYEQVQNNYQKKLYYEENKNDNIQLKSRNKSQNKKINIEDMIKEYENQNDRLKQKISDMFDLNNKKGLYNKKKEKSTIVDEQNVDCSYIIQKKYNDLEEKFENEKFRREQALLKSMNNFQKKIDNLMAKSEEKNKQIKNKMVELDKIREKALIERHYKYNKVREQYKDNEKKQETKRENLLKTIQKKDLKNFAIKQERLKMFEERKKINEQTKEERKTIKAKIEKLINDEKQNKRSEISDEMFNKIISEKSK